MPSGAKSTAAAASRSSGIVPLEVSRITSAEITTSASPMSRCFPMFIVPASRHNIIIPDACWITFSVMVFPPLAARMRLTLERVRSSSRKQPVCRFRARA